MEGIVVASGANLVNLSKSLTHEARPERLAPRPFRKRTVYCNPKATSILDDITMVIEDFRERIDMLNSTIDTAQKARARFFQQSLRTLTGESTKEQHFIIKDGNEAVHSGDIITDRALIKRRMPEYRDEFRRIYGFTIEESGRFVDEVIIKTLNKRATLHTTKQWNLNLEADFRTLVSFHDECSDQQWNEFLQSWTTREALAWLSIDRVRVIPIGRGGA